MTYGWGLGEWGTSPWGTGEPAPVAAFASVYATGDHTVRVTLSFEPQNQNGTILGDALNPQTWQITVPSTGRILSPIRVVRLNATTYDISTWEKFDPVQVEMKVTSTTLLNVAGNPVGILEAGFPGSLRENTDRADKLAARRGFAYTDIRNPITPNSPAGGTLEITAGGDYQSETGPAFVRKLIVRRLLSTPARLSPIGRGDFFHLPEYGAGIPAQVKGMVSTANLVALKKLIEQQTLLEPEVSAAVAKLSFNAANGILNIELQARLKSTGQTVNVSLPVGTA